MQGVQGETMLVAKPRVVIHPDGLPPPDKNLPSLLVDRREWDVLDDHTIIHRSLTPRKR